LNDFASIVLAERLSKLIQLKQRGCSDRHDCWTDHRAWVGYIQMNRPMCLTQRGLRQSLDRPCRARPADPVPGRGGPERRRRPRPDGTGSGSRAAFAACQRCSGRRGRASPSGRGGADGATVCKGHPRWPCHKRAIHSGPDRFRADNHEQRQSFLDLRRSPSSQVIAAPDLALGARGHRPTSMSGNPP
jgi:hypothetical protein